MPPNTRVSGYKPTQTLNISGALTVGTLVDFISLQLLCPDSISGRFLKEVGDEIAAALTILFNASLKHTLVWKRRQTSNEYSIILL